MCIRDRVKRAISVLWPHTKAPLSQTEQPIDRDLPFNLTIGCLLYTSDAADDLLCVDLGGRRIIKKKKKRNKKKMKIDKVSKMEQKQGKAK